MFDITAYTPTADNVLLRIDKEDNISILTKKVKTINGVLSFDFDYFVDETTRELKQSRELMDVISVGPKCNLCKPGDIAIVDYTVIDTDDILLHEDSRYAYYCLSEGRVIVQEEHGVCNKQGAYCKIYDKGDCTMESSIYGVIRDEKIICNDDYIILTQEDAENNFQLNQFGLWVINDSNIKGDYLSATVEFAPYNSKYKQGDVIMVYKYYPFTKNIQCNAFLMCNEQDISAVIN